MLISHKHKFITVDIPKTGTRSLRETFFKLGIIDVQGKPCNSNSDDKLEQHASILDIKQGFIDNGWNGFDDYYKYSVVRNPWDRYFSFFTFYKTKAKEYSESFEYLDELAKAQGKMSVDLFTNNTYAEVLKTLIHNNPPHSYFLLNEVDYCEFNRVTLFEDLIQGFNDFCLDVGVTVSTLMHSNKSTSVLTKEEVYTQELIDMVAEKEKWVIDKFSYDLTH